MDAVLLVLNFMFVVLVDTTLIQVPGVGRIRCNFLANGVTEALNIPYAMPPVASRRFRPPQPWRGPAQNEIDGTSYGPLCIQSEIPGVVLPPMSEDCLSLNIWTPRTDARLPVFVFIHGGAFTAGGGRAYNGSNLAAAGRGAVTVTINYRLGAFGWLPSKEIANENPDAPGNGAVHGFLDQLEALHWVQKHITAFGGDPTQVTIGGESAGGLSVCTHVHLPAAQGLFARGIVESGSCVGPWGAWSNSTEGKAEDLFMLSVGAFNLSALRNLSAEKLVKSPFWNLVTPSPDGWWLKKTPADLPVLSSQIQVLLGSNTMDSLFAPPWVNNLPSPIGPILKRLIPTTRFAYDSLVQAYFGHEALLLYPAPVKGSADDYRKAFIRINTDVCNTCPKHWLAQKLRLANTTVFAYSFGFWPNTSAGGIWDGLACHGCEMDFVFKSRLGQVLGGYVGNYTDAFYNEALADAISEYWTSFVAFARPIGAVPWPAYNLTSRRQILKIAGDAEGRPTITQSSPLELPQCAFFDRYWKASRTNRNRVDEFCTLPAPRLSTQSQLIVV